MFSRFFCLLLSFACSSFAQQNTSDSNQKDSRPRVLYPREKEGSKDHFSPEKEAVLTNDNPAPPILRATPILRAEEIPTKAQPHTSKSPVETPLLSEERYPKIYLNSEHQRKILIISDSQGLGYFANGLLSELTKGGHTLSYYAGLGTGAQDWLDGAAEKGESNSKHATTTIRKLNPDKLKNLSLEERSAAILNGSAMETLEDVQLPSIDYMAEKIKADHAVIQLGVNMYSCIRTASNQTQQNLILESLIKCKAELTKQIQEIVQKVVSKGMTCTWITPQKSHHFRNKAGAEKGWTNTQEQIMFDVIKGAAGDLCNVIDGREHTTEEAINPPDYIKVGGTREYIHLGKTEAKEWGQKAARLIHKHLSDKDPDDLYSQRLQALQTLHSQDRTEESSPISISLPPETSTQTLDAELLSIFTAREFITGANEEEIKTSILNFSAYKYIMAEFAYRVSQDSGSFKKGQTVYVWHPILWPDKEASKGVLLHNSINLKTGDHVQIEDVVEYEKRNKKYALEGASKLDLGIFNFEDTAYFSSKPVVIQKK